MKNRSVWFAYFLVIVAVVIRVLSHERILPLPANFAPVAALALFGGVFLGKKYAIIVPLAAEILSDFIIGFYDLGVMLSVWLSFAAVGLIGLLLRKHKNITNIIYASLGASVLFFVATNFAVWAQGAWYDKTWQGLVLCFTMALPFFRNTILGDIFFIAVFFGIYEFVLYLNKVREGTSKKLAKSSE